MPRLSRSSPLKKLKKSRKTCKQKLASKIKINMTEYKAGRWKSPKQAIAVSYSQVLKKSPKCKSALRRKPKK